MQTFNGHSPMHNKKPRDLYQVAGLLGERFTG